MPTDLNTIEDLQYQRRSKINVLKISGILLVGFVALSAPLGTLPLIIACGLAAAMSEKALEIRAINKKLNVVQEKAASSEQSAPARSTTSTLDNVNSPALDRVSEKPVVEHASTPSQPSSKNEFKCYSPPKLK